MSEKNIPSFELHDRDLDRLVDGELTRNEYCRVVKLVGTTQNGWKRCALAFLESQAFERDMMMLGPLETDTRKSHEGHMANGHATSDARAASDVVQPNGSTGDRVREGADPVDELLSNKNGTSRPGANRLRAFTHGKVQSPRTEKGHDRGPSYVKSPSPHSVNAQTPDRLDSKSHWMRTVAVAASLLLAFIVGIAGRSWLDTNQNNDARLGQSDIDLPDGTNQGESQTGDATTLVGGDTPPPLGHANFDFGDGNEIGGTNNEPRDPLKIPLYGGSSLPAPDQVGLTPQMRRQLNDAGIQVRTQRQIVQVRTEDGRTVIVPLETFEFVRGENRRFQ